MRDGWERKVRSSSFFYQNMASRAREKRTYPGPLFFPQRPSGPAAGTSPSLRLTVTSKVLLFILRPLGIISWRPCPRVRPRRHATQRARRRWEIFKLSLSATGMHSHGASARLRAAAGRRGGARAAGTEARRRATLTEAANFNEARLRVRLRLHGVSGCSTRLRLAAASLTRSLSATQA